MKKIINLLFITMLFILVGCSSKEVTTHNYTYKGENEFWTAELNVKGESGFIKKGDRNIYTSDSDSLITFTYKKDLAGLSQVKYFKISYKSSIGERGTSTTFDDNTPLDSKTFTIKDSRKDSAFENKDEIIQASIEINGKKQTFELKNVDQK